MQCKKKETGKNARNARNECVIHVTFRGTSPKMDHWPGLGMYPSNIMYSSLSSCSFCTMLMRVASCASLMLLRGVVDVHVEGGLDLLRWLFYVAAVEVQILNPLSEIMIALGRVRRAEQQRVEEFLLNSSYHRPSPSSRAAAIQSCLHSTKMMLPHPATGCTDPSWVDI